MPVINDEYRAKLRYELEHGGSALERWYFGLPENTEINFFKTAFFPLLIIGKLMDTETFGYVFLGVAIYFIMGIFGYVAFTQVDWEIIKGWEGL